MRELGLSIVVHLLCSIQTNTMNIAAEVRLSRLQRSLLHLANEAVLDYTVPAMEVDLDEARLTFETNFISVISMCQTFLPLLMKANGTIVQIGSIAGVCLHDSPVIGSRTRRGHVLTIRRSFRTCLVRSTMPPRLLFTHLAIPSVLS